MSDGTFLERYGPWALIAGASEGTGASFARMLAAKGLNLVLVARRPGPLEALAGEIRRDHGTQCVTASIDLAADDAAAQMEAAAAGREIGLFIANAGSDWNGSLFLDNAIEAWDALAMRNVMTVMRGCHRFAGPMKARGRGGLILVSSAACFFGMPGIVVYAATKAFNQALGEGLWVELKPYGIDVLNLVMGQTDTPGHREHFARLGMPFPEGIDTSDEVAAIGLARLGDGPSVVMGQTDEEATVSGLSMAARKARVEASGKLAMSYLLKD